MMTIPESGETLGRIVRGVVKAVRQSALADAPTDPVDRVLAATALAAGAIVIIWPQGRKVPAIISGASEIARHVWRRRSWFLPS